MNCGGYSVTYETWRYFTLKALDERKENAGLEITDEFIASDEGKALNESILAEADESIKSLYAVFALAKEYGSISKTKRSSKARTPPLNRRKPPTKANAPTKRLSRTSI